MTKRRISWISGNEKPIIAAYRYSDSKITTLEMNVKMLNSEEVLLEVIELKVTGDVFKAKVSCNPARHPLKKNCNSKNPARKKKSHKTF